MVCLQIWQCVSTRAKEVTASNYNKHSRSTIGSCDVAWGNANFSHLNECHVEPLIRIYCWSVTELEAVPGPRREIQIRERPGPPRAHTIRVWPGPPGRLRNSRAPREYGKNVSEQANQHAITE